MPRYGLSPFEDYDRFREVQEERSMGFETEREPECSAEDHARFMAGIVRADAMYARVEAENARLRAEGLRR